MADVVLPKLEQNSATEQLPKDPTALLTPEQQRDLRKELARLARLRREVERESNDLKLA